MQPVRLEGFLGADDLRERRRSDPASDDAEEDPVLAGIQALDRGGAEQRRAQAIERARRTAACT